MSICMQYKFKQEKVWNSVSATGLHRILCCCVLCFNYWVPKQHYLGSSKTPVCVLTFSGGLDEALYNVIAMAREQEIPFVFALGRKALGRCVNKLVPVSVVGIFNYFGAEVRLWKAHPPSPRPSLTLPPDSTFSVDSCQCCG